MIKSKEIHKSKFIFSLLSILFILNILPLKAVGQSEQAPLSGFVSDPMVEAQEKLIHARGSYRTIQEQSGAIKDLKKAVKLKLKAARLRAKAEKLQSKADILTNKATQNALSRGLYITNPLSPIKMQPPNTPTANMPPQSPVPGQPINIVLPRQETVSQQNYPMPPVPGGF